MPRLFDPITVKGVVFRNRIGVSPMCMYSYEDGNVTAFQTVHLGSRALGGAGLVIAEATAVEPEGRITSYDAGIWGDHQVELLSKTASAIKDGGAVAGIQISHAGRKASTKRPGDGGGAILPSEPSGWQVIGPSPVPFSDTYPMPREMDLVDIERVQNSFVIAAQRALLAGFEFLEIHAAHGYLLHSFYSPISNHRADEYGGSSQNRIRFVLETVNKVRTVWPDRYPLCVRISGTDWVDGGWTIEDSVELAKQLITAGVDIIDCSSGGGVSTAKVPVAPGYQVPISKEVKAKAGILTSAVGLINNFELADQIIQDNSADFVLLGREFLRNPTWPIQAAIGLGFPAPIPPQYVRGY